jgi:hypothetical protein
VLTSTYRLNSSDKWRQAGFERPESISFRAIRPGHIVTVNPTENNPWGTHIVIAAAAPDYDGSGKFRTYEGNAAGIRGDGSRGKGVVMRARRLQDVACVWEFGPEHFRGADR